MPVLNGIEATRRIKNDFPAITVIGLSVHRDQDMANAMKDAGADSYFIKGNSSDELCRMLINSKSKSKAGNPSSKPFAVIPPLPIPASDKRTSLLPLLLLQPGCFHGVTEQHGDRHRSGTTGRGT